MIKVLYVSSWHPVLEFDDLNLLSSLGFDWFSTGHYKNPKIKTRFFLRDIIDKDISLDLINEYNKNNNLNITESTTISDLIKTPINITKEFADKFDIIIVNGWFSGLKDYNNFKHKCVVWRTYMSQTPEEEVKATKLVKSGLRIARMFEGEEQILSGNKGDGLLRNYVDSNIYKDWVGDEETLLTFQNHLKSRSQVLDSRGDLWYPEYQLYLKIQDRVPSKMYGFENGDLHTCKGCLDWKDQIKEYRTSRAYMALPVKPAPYTYNFMEALMTGIPTINFNNITETYKHPWYGYTYKVPSIIQHMVSGILVETSEDIVKYFKILKQDYGLTKEISKNSRNIAIKKFDKGTILLEWVEFFNRLGFK